MEPKHEKKIQEAHDHASQALSRYAELNGQIRELKMMVENLERDLEMKHVFAKPDSETEGRITKLETRATKHLGHLRAHRARLDAMDGTRKPAPATFTATPSAPGKFTIPTATLAKAAARPVIQTRPVLTASDLLAKADANLTGSAYGQVEALVRKNKLEDAAQFMQDHAHQERENDLLKRVERLQNLHPDHRKLLNHGIRDGHHEIAEPLVRRLEAQPGSGVRKGSR
jgi:TolA-binding protein